MNGHESGNAWFTSFCKVSAGTRMYRNHPMEVEGIEILGSDFNPCKGAGGRFSPLYTPEGRCVSTLYAASSFRTAAIEAVYRNYGVTRDPLSLIVDPIEIKTRRVTVLRPLRDLTLISFLSENLKNRGICMEKVIGPKRYSSISRKFAERAMRENIGVDGIAWKSARSGNDNNSEWCYVIFCHHYYQHSNETLFDAEQVEDGRYIDDMNALAKEIGYVIDPHGS